MTTTETAARIKHLRQVLDDGVQDVRLTPPRLGNGGDAEDQIGELQDDYEDGLLDGIGDITGDLVELGVKVRLLSNSGPPGSDSPDTLGTLVGQAADAIRQYLTALRERPSNDQ
jgi:hypothetical protein